MDKKKVRKSQDSRMNNTVKGRQDGATEHEVKSRRGKRPTSEIKKVQGNRQTGDVKREQGSKAKPQRKRVQERTTKVSANTREDRSASRGKSPQDNRNKNRANSQQKRVQSKQTSVSVKEKAAKKKEEVVRKKNASRENFSQYKFVIRELTAREIKRKYSRSVLGIVWSVLNPLLSMAIISLIFSQIFRRSIENFPIYFLSGSILWQLFTDATNAAMTTFVDNKSMLIKVKLPMQIFVLARVYTALVNLGYSLVAYIVMLFFFQITQKITMLFAPVIVLFLLLFALGVSYILSTAYVFFGDIKHLYTVVLTLLMYCSALFYPVEQLSRGMYTIVSNNPVFNYIDALRSVVMLGELPSTTTLLRMVFWGIGVYFFGHSIFKKNKNTIMQKI